MRRYLAVLALSVAAASPALASPAQTWNFTYQGFHHVEAGAFDPAATVSGSFTARDLNGNSVIERDELLEFTLAGLYDFINPYGCNYDAYLKCTFDTFTYANGSLNVGILWWGNDEAVSGWGGYFATGEGFNRYRYRDAEWTETTYQWTPQTSFQITPPPSPIPEPSTVAMLGIGLTGITLAQLRRRRR